MWRRLREGGFQNIKMHFSISNAVEGMVEALQVAVDGDGASEGRNSLSMDERTGKARRRLELGGCSLNPRCGGCPEGGQAQDLFPIA